MSLVGLFKGKGDSGFSYNSTAEQVTDGIDLGGKTVLLTGCNSGLGQETLRVLGLRGAHVIATARTEEKATSALAASGTTGTPVACELSEPKSVHDCIARVESLGRRIDAIICCAGIMALPKLRKIHGFEAQFFTNHIGHFILVTGLLDTLADDGRVVMVSSRAHHRVPKEGIELDNLGGDRGYSAFRAYGQSKLANLLFAKHLATKLPGRKQTSNAIHPGVIDTNLTRHMIAFARVGMKVTGSIFLKSIPQGAATQCYVATHPDVATKSGEYFLDCNVGQSSRVSNDAQLAARLWAKSEEIVASLD